MTYGEILEKYSITAEVAEELFKATKTIKYIQTSLYKTSHACGVSLTNEDIKEISNNYPIDKEVTFSSLVDIIKEYKNHEAK